MTTKKNGEAVDFYEKYGWSQELVVPDWFNGADYVQMRKDLELATEIDDI